MGKPGSDNNKRSSYEAFNDVDQLVAKPVFGSDGAASWQEFQKKNPTKKRQHTAPLAPLKKADRAAGFKSWNEERQVEEEVRKKSGLASLDESGYVNFRKKDEEQDIVKLATDPRVRPEEATYFLPSETFAGWKFDYVFTTRDRGTGYYWDGMDTFKREQGTEHATEDGTVERSTDQGDGLVAIHKSNKKSSESKPKEKKKKKKRKLEGPVMVNDPNNPMEQVAAVLRKQQELASLPAGWNSARDASGKTYYYNQSSGERSWDRPSESKLPDGWSIAKDPSTGKEYFYNAATKETRWEKPS